MAQLSQNLRSHKIRSPNLPLTLCGSYSYGSRLRSRNLGQAFLPIPVNLEERLPVHLCDCIEHWPGEDDLGDVIGNVGIDSEVGAPQFRDVDDPFDNVEVELWQM